VHRIFSAAGLPKLKDFPKEFARSGEMAAE
jgi:hypothetical protein